MRRIPACVGLVLLLGTACARCAADSLLTYVDGDTPLLKENGAPDDALFLAERLHLNAEGYAVWARVVDAAVPVEGF